MRNRRNTAWGLLLGAGTAALLLTGCRAFTPEAVIVNKPPETYIIGAPMEEGGGYYHFHVYWYGSDVDGTVERFVWALTDTSVQDEDTTDDEEDARFNPALDASTLAIGRWTTKTDSIFDFRIDQGTRPSADFTLHMVAQDDLGAFDRTPARLHFFSNTLGNPTIRFFRIAGGDTIAIEPGKADTVGFGMPYTVAWAGESPNIRGYAPDALARVDTVYPFDDGLFGYKWQILGELGGNCVPTLEDCWRPRRFNEATGDSFSYFGDMTSLTFRNDGSSTTNPFRKLLPSGTVSLLVNSIDVAGVEVAEFQREFNFLVNFDPETIILDGETDWAHPEDDQVYPYYFRLNDPTKTRVPFRSGDRIPDRTYVVVKALARDDPDDQRQRDDFAIGLVGYVEGVRHSLSGGVFRFATESSALDTVPAWPATEPGGWHADTLGFLTGPRTTFTFNMQAVDEHGRRDGSPARLNFDVGYPPCVQCVELLPKTASVSAFPASLECHEPDDGGNACFADTASYLITTAGAGADELQRLRTSFMAINKGTGFTQVVDDTTGLGRTNYIVGVTLYNLTVLLHGRDDEREAWSQPVRRAMAWRYQVDYECDPFNQIKDGGGNDDIERYTWAESADDQLRIDASTGLWRMRVEVAVPTTLINGGPVAYWFGLLFDPSIGGGTNEALADEIFVQSLRQLGEGSVRVVAVDQSQCAGTPARPNRYNYFRAVRPSIMNLPAGRTWRDCDLPTAPQVPGIKSGLDLGEGAMESRQHKPRAEQPAVKHFRLQASIGGQLIDCNTPPPRP
ncbi:MAG: hypothetical protein IH621_18000 [Krumholzibacteria bacterium]|nr:hypothetical protein [Candidatus Krumholzibacteria bacterium]